MIDGMLTVTARRSEWDATLASIGRTPLQRLPAFPDAARHTETLAASPSTTGVVEPGRFEILVGASAADLRLRHSLDVTEEGE